MQIRNLSTVAVISLALAACQADRGDRVGTSDDQAAIDANTTAWAKAWNARDASAMAALMANDYQEVTPMGEHISSATAAQENLAGEFQQMPEGVTIQLDTEFTEFTGTSAYSGGTWTTEGMPNDMPRRGSWLVIQEKEGDNWKITAGLASTDVTPLIPVMQANSGNM